MMDIIMTSKTIKIKLDHIAEIGEFHLMVYSVDKIIETDQDVNRIIEIALGEEILEKYENE